MRSPTLSLLAAAVTIAALGPAPAEAQLAIGDFSLEGDVEAGFRYFLERPSPSRRGKFEEYRDIDQGFFLDELRLRLFRPDESYSVGLRGSKWGQDDQEFSLRAGRLGLWEFGFDWDQTPHVFSTTARMRAVETSRGVFTLPPRPDAGSLSLAEGTEYNQAPELGEVGLRWDTARFSFRATPTPQLDLRAEYTRIDKDGDRPFGVAFGSPGNDFMEVLEPIEQQVHDVRLRATWAEERWQVQAGYTLSIFQNSVSSVTADNPLQATDGAFVPSPSGGSSVPAAGRVSLAPDNMAHTFTLAGGVSLPMATRLTANVSYSLRFQNDPFLPHTRNPNIPAAALTLPQRDLDGLVGVTLLHLNASTRPLRLLTLTARYRYFDYDDMTEDLTFSSFVINDRTLLNEARTAGRFEFARHNAGLDARVRVLPSLALTLGPAWERWDRNEHWEVRRSDEYFAKAAVDATPFDWLLVQLTYRPSWRRIDRYDTFAHLAHTVVEEPFAEAPQSQSPLLRKFDQGERDRQRVDLLLQFLLTDTLTTSLTGAWMDDDYIESSLGLQEATTWSTGIDLTWTPTERLAVFAGYSHENIRQDQRSRNRDRTFTAPVVVADFSDWDWISEHTDTVDTVRLGLNVAIIPRRLDWTAEATWAYARGEVDTRNPVTPQPHPPEFPSTANATARTQPAFEDRLIRLDTALRYRFRPAWAVSVGYTFESFRKDDWRTDRLNPFMPGSNSIWLGNDARNYTAHIVGVKLRYTFR